MDNYYSKLISLKFKDSKGNKQTIKTELNPAFSLRNFCLLSLSLFTLLSIVGGVWGQTTATYNSSGAKTWTPPAGNTGISTIECWSGGGNGNNSGNAGGGGSGGSYSRSVGTFSVSSSSTYNFSVGAAASSSWFRTDAGSGAPANNTQGIFSVAGVSATGRTGATAATAGNFGPGTLTATYGGNGGTGASSGGTRAGGGGGASPSSTACTACNGGNGSGATGGTGGTAPSGGGNGGAGASGNATSGTAPGGGGGGSGTGTAGSGAVGQIKITFACGSAYSLAFSANSISNICAGSSATFSIAGATTLPVGTYTVTYSVSNPSSAGNTASMTVSSAGNGSFTIPSGLLTNSGSVTITITNLSSGGGTAPESGSISCSNSISSNNTATFTITANVAASVSIASSDADNTFCSGTSVTFTATPTNGGAGPTYQWQKNGSNIAGETGSTYTTTTLVNSDVIRVIMTSNATCATGSPATSSGITNTVNANQSVSVSITSSDADNSICSGTSVTFTATPTNGGASPSYQWKKNNIDISGETASTYVTTTLANNDQIKVVMTSNATCPTGNPATSGNITTTVSSVPSAASNHSPANSTSGVSTAGTTLSWDATANATGYKVYFDQNAIPTTLVSTQAGTTYSTGVLTASSTYYWKIVPYNACGDATSSTTVSFQTAAPCFPSSQATIGAYTNNTTGTSLTVNWSRGNGDGVIVVARETASANVLPTEGNNYTANAIYSSGNTTGSGNFVVYKGTGTSVAISGLTQATDYTFIIYEYNTSGYCYNTPGSSSAVSTPCSGAPTTQASSITFTNIGGTEMTLNWTNGNGSSRVVKINTANSFTSPTDGTDPTANSVYGGTGEQVVYNGSGNTFDVSGLSATTTYYFRVYEKNCSSTFSKYITSTATANPSSQITNTVYKTVTNLTGVIYWANTTTWVGGALPPNDGSAEIVIQAFSGTYAATNIVVGPDVNFTVKKITINSGANFCPTNSGSGGGGQIYNLTVNEDFINNGYLTDAPFAKSASTNITIKGNFTQNGAYSHYGASTPCAANWIFAGTSNQTIDGTGSIYSAGNGSSAFQITNTAGTVTLNTNVVTTATIGSYNMAVTVGANSNLIFGSSSIAFSGGGALTLNGSTTLSAATFNGHYAMSGTRTIAATSTITYTNSASSITATTNIPTASPGNLVIDVGGGTCTLGANLTPAGNLTITSGTYDLASFTSNRSAAGGTLTLGSGAVLKIGGTNAFPANYNAHSINSASTVEYYGSTQTITSPLNSSQSYGNLTVTTSGIKTAQAALSVAGNVTVNTSSTLALSTFTSAVTGNVTNSGTITFGVSTGRLDLTGNLTNSGTITCGTTSALNITGNWANSGTFTPSTSTVTFNKTSGTQTLNNGSSSFNNLTHSAAGTLQIESNNLFVSGALTNSAGILNMNGLTNTVTGLTTVSGGTYSASTNTQNFNGGLTIIGGTFTGSTGNVNITNLTLTSGSFTSSSNQLSVTGTFTNNATFTHNSGTVAFTGTTGQQTIAGTVETTFSGLRIDNTSGVKPTQDVTVNGILNLNSANPTANNYTGLLEMVQSYGSYADVHSDNSTDANNNLDSKILTLGSVATVTGSGDVTGKIRRASFTSGVTYTFGNPNMQMTFNQNGGTLPTEIIVVATIGAQGVHVDKDDDNDDASNSLIGNKAVQRMYQILKTDGALPARFNVRFPYLASELNGNTEANLVTWDHHLPYAGMTPHEHGKTSINTTENWIELSDHGMNYLANKNDPAFTKYWMLSDKVSTDTLWLGSATSSWTTSINWSSGAVPSNWTKIVIDPAIDNNELTITGSQQAATMYIKTGGVVNGGTGTLILNGGPAINGGSGTWVNDGTFNAGTGTVQINSTDGTISGTTEFHNLTINSGKLLKPQSGSLIKIKGTLTNNGTLDATSNANTIEYTGSGQTIYNPNGTTAGYYNLKVSQTSASNLTLGENIRLKGTLYMNTGDIIVNGKTLEIGLDATTPGSVNWTSGTVRGPMKRWFGTSPNSSVESGIFPIGADLGGTKGVTNRYAQVNFTGNPDGGYIIAEYKTGLPSTGYNGLPLNYSSGSYPQAIQNYEEEGYWDITPYDANGDDYAALNSTPYTLKLRLQNPSTLTTGWTPSNDGNDLYDVSTIRLIRAKGSTGHASWELAGNHVSAVDNGNGDYSITASGITEFSWFNGGGNNQNPLPVELVSFTGACENSLINLTWQTASEFNSSHFDVEKSRDGENWQVLTTLPSAGTSNELITYQTMDQNGTDGNNYFRLRQVDIDGKEKLYDPINVSCSEVTTGYFSSFPNPSGPSFQLIVNNKDLIGDYILNITDASGIIIEQQKINMKEGVNMYVINQELTPGIYFLHITNGSKSTPIIRHAVK